MRALIAVTVLASCLMSGIIPAQASPETRRTGLGIKGRANHLHPLPGEPQTIRWVVRNLGTTTIDRVIFRTRIPAGWRLAGKEPAGCAISGHRVRCDLENLKPRASTRLMLRLVVPREARPGTVRITARTTIAVAGTGRPGPAMTLRLTVVRSR